MIKHILLAAVLLISGYLYYTGRVITYGHGVVAPQEPVQEHAFGAKEIKIKDYTLSPLANFDAEVRVLSRKIYTSDRLAELSPLDIMVGWGPMSDEKILNEILIKQSDRYFDLQITHQPIPRHKMVSKSANLHVIPSSEEVNNKLREARQGHVIRIKGYLVEINSPDGWSVKSSLKRDDYGDKASEILYVKEIDFVEQVTPQPASY